LWSIQKKTIQISILWANLYIRSVLVRRYAAACRSWNYNETFTFRAFPFFAGVRFGNADFLATAFAEKSDFSLLLWHHQNTAALWAFHPPAAEFIRRLDLPTTIVTAKINHNASRRLNYLHFAGLLPLFEELMSFLRIRHRITRFLH